MKIITLYDSIHGKSKKVASLLPNHIHVSNIKKIEKYDFFIFICPTYGDEELPIEMENFIIKLKTKNKYYTICELGNYFGDTYDFGAKIIIEKLLQNLNWKKFHPCLSLDSMPNIQWNDFYKWKEKVHEILSKFNIK